MFSRNVDWSEELGNGKWDNLGRSAIEEHCTHKKTEGQSDYNMRYSGYCEECGHCEDSAMPMMNYAYPLETTPSEEGILEVIEKTNLTVMYNNDEDKYYLVLTGGGMDLSQDIALAYNIIERWIPLELALRVSTQNGLSQGGKDFRRVMRACKESIQNDISNGKERVKKIKIAIGESLITSREKRNK